MSDGWKPRKGSLAEKLIGHLAKKPKAVSSAEVAALFAYSPNGVGSGLKGAVEGGALVCHKEGRTLFWSLPDGAAPPQQPTKTGKSKRATSDLLEIGSWSDGDVSVRGGVLNEDDSVTYTRAQMQQLLEHVTTPHITTRPTAAAQG